MSSPGWDTDRLGLRVAVLLVLCALFVLGRACTVSAQDVPDVTSPCAPEITENRRAVLEHDGQAGIWFHLEVSRCLLGRVSALPEYVLRVRLLESHLELSEQRTQLLREQVALAVKAEERATSALEAAVRGRRKAEEALNAWYRHPALWFTIGVVVTAALQAVAVWTISEVSP